ncbi:SxtJ family membrane protein [Bradyrhizobium sp. HKCCYLS3077]|uniref:SxtJ family membrane protein n=1 Tax=Bradyrhizobium sp. HKCCYLS3077 TaxID=3420761 RepID=UPI003EBB5030
MATALEQSSHHSPPPGSSERQFGLVFAGFFVLVAGLPLIRFDQPRWWAVAVALAFAAVALIRPQLLRVPNRLWLRFGELLHRIVSPIIMGAIFFGCISPIAWIMRRSGRDLLALKRDRQLQSYWIDRPREPPDRSALKRQF